MNDNSKIDEYDHALKEMQTILVDDKNAEGALIEHTEKLRDSDLKPIAQLFWLYRFVELDWRRRINALREARLGPEHKNASIL